MSRAPNLSGGELEESRLRTTTLIDISQFFAVKRHELGIVEQENEEVKRVTGLDWDWLN